MTIGRFLAAVQAKAIASASAATRDSYPEHSALDAEEIDAFVERVSYAVLSTTRPDGRPHAAPVGYVPTDDRIWMASVAGATRLRNLGEHPFASLVVVEGNRDEHIALIVEGTVTRHPDPVPILDDWLRDAWRDRYGTELTWAGSLIELEPTKVLSYGHGRVIGLGLGR
ncbi:MAG TPA: pyridoxamine 5'-phosphate oxidase family protein [Actinomycetota bacterium]|nr:pyridoxamine 5'-phosphate oxidase family protein [Actinomycetota bacterium]